MSLSPEREKEIRYYHAKADELTYGNVVIELLGELDRVRAESCADLIGQEHRLGTRIEILEIELDRVREENQRWRDTVRDQDNELDDFRAKLDLAVEREK